MLKQKSQHLMRATNRGMPLMRLESLFLFTDFARYQPEARCTQNRFDFVHKTADAHRPSTQETCMTLTYGFFLTYWQKTDPSSHGFRRNGTHLWSRRFQESCSNRVVTVQCNNLPEKISLWGETARIRVLIVLLRPGDHTGIQKSLIWSSALRCFDRRLINRR
jgi:hypothetical protein